MFSIFWWRSRCPITISSPSMPTQTTVICGLPSLFSVVRVATGAVAIRSRIDSGSVILPPRKRVHWMPDRGGHRYDRSDSGPVRPYRLFIVPSGARSAMIGSSANRVNGTCRKLGRPGNGRPYEVNSLFRGGDSVAMTDFLRFVKLTGFVVRLAPNGKEQAIRF